MSLLPRRLRPGHPGHVAVHPGWTLSPPTAEQSGGPDVESAGADLPASRWTSSPALPPLPAPLPVPAPVPAHSLSAWVEAPAAPIATVLSAPLPLAIPAEDLRDEPVFADLHKPVVRETAPAEPLAPVPDVVAQAAPEAPSWTSEWEAVAATPLAASGPVALHTAAAAALEAVFDQPAEVLAPPPAPVSALTALDLPLPAGTTAVDTPLAAQAVAFLQSAAPARTVAVPPPAQQFVERAVRTAPSAPQQRRSTVRLGFTDASVIDLRPDDPMAKALHTVADALIGRDPL